MILLLKSRRISFLRGADESSLLQILFTWRRENERTKATVEKKTLIEMLSSRLVEDFFSELYANFTFFCQLLKSFHSNEGIQTLPAPQMQISRIPEFETRVFWGTAKQVGPSCDPIRYCRSHKYDSWNRGLEIMLLGCKISIIIAQFSIFQWCS